MLVEMNQRVDIKPWTIEPQIDVDKLGMWLPSVLNLPMLRQLLSKAQGCKDF